MTLASDLAAMQPRTTNPSPPCAPGGRFSLRASVPRCLRGAWILGLLVASLSASGASCPLIVRQYTQPIPRALPPQATLTQIIDVVNDNTARVQSLSTTRATISTPGFPALNANIAMLRPRSFRIIGEKFGTQLDVGSNDELMWMWLRYSQPPALFYCRHDQFAASAARQIMPVEPDWLVEAFGLVTFDRNAQLQGPTPVGNGRVEVRSRQGEPGRETARITIIDASTGLVLERHVYDEQGQLVASAVLSKHVQDPATGAKLPRHIQIQWPPAKLELTVDMTEISVNQLTGNPAELFAKPSYSGYTEIDLAQPGLQLVPNSAGQFQAAPEARYDVPPQGGAGGSLQAPPEARYDVAPQGRAGGSLPE